MVLYGHSETYVETVFYGIFVAIAFFLLPFAIVFAKRNQSFGKFILLLPTQCVFVGIDNLLMLRGTQLNGYGDTAKFGNAVQACITPIFLTLCFDLAYIVHKNRSVNFFCISFDQGHRNIVEPWSWMMRNWMRLISLFSLAIGILVNFRLVGSSPYANQCGYYDWRKDASAPDAVLSLIPGTVLSIFNLIISFRLWLYGTNRALVINATVFNSWGILLIGAIGQLLGQVPSERYYPVSSNAGETLLLICVTYSFHIIHQDFQLSTSFNTFLDKYEKVAASRSARPSQPSSPKQKDELASG